MKANELMIGDWVRNDFGEIQKVVELHENGAMLSYNDIYSYDLLEPIPITPEILEKNGFDAYGDIFVYEKDGIYLQIKLNEYVRIFCGMDNSVSFDSDFYIHRLQHALRLYKIDKEIML